MQKKTVGFTTTIPVEIIFAGKFIPCDLNNVFVTDNNPLHFLKRADKDGFPKSMCNWIKGMYGVIMERKINTVITVMEGDCSNTQALAEILKYRGVKVIPFSFPYDRDKKVLKREIEKLKQEFSVKKHELDYLEEEIKKVRLNLEEIDRMTWQEKVITGYENHLWLVRASDMLGDYNKYNHMAESFIETAKTRQSVDGINIGLIGVPPIFMDLHEVIESNGAHVVFNETQRQFALPYFSQDIDLVEKYRRYTYPYGIFLRIEDIKREIKRRNIKGLIHYVQAFCYRVMEDVILRDVLDIPFITIEGDLPSKIDSRTRLRIEAFIEMLKERD